MGLHVSSQCSIFMLSETLSNLWFSDAFSRDIESKNWLNMGSLYKKICLIYLSCILITAHRFLNLIWVDFLGVRFEGGEWG